MTDALELARLTAPAHFSEEDIERRAQSLLREGCDISRVLDAIIENRETMLSLDQSPKKGTLAEAQLIASYALNGIWQGNNAIEVDLIHLARLVLSLGSAKSSVALTLAGSWR